MRSKLELAADVGAAKAWLQRLALVSMSLGWGAMLAGASVVDSSSGSWQEASDALILASHTDFCGCPKSWEAFRTVVNFTLAHSTASHAFGDGVVQLCLGHAQPLISAAFAGEGGVVAAARGAQRDALRSTGACAAGLLSALAICAEAHGRMASAEAGEASKGSAAEALEEDPGFIALDFDPGLATSEFSAHLPGECELSAACLAYAEVFLAFHLLPHGAGCLDSSVWPVRMGDITTNFLRWLRLLRFSPRLLPPPRWRGPSARERARAQRPLAAAGAFAGVLRKAPLDASGISQLIAEVGHAWGNEFVQGLDGATGEGPPPLAARHLRQVFGLLAFPSYFGGRGPLRPQVSAHRDDFAGPRAGLRFLVYDLPGAAHAVLLAALHGHVREAEPQPSGCDFALSPCTEALNGEGAFMCYRSMAGEVTFLAKLLSAPEGVLTENPAEATYFVVPFFSSTWCFLAAPRGWVRCNHHRPLNALLPLLRHYNASTAHRHLFLATDSTGDLPIDLQMQPLLLTYGPTPCEASHLIAPPPITDELPVPTAHDFGTKDLFLFARDGISNRPFRREAIEELSRWQQRLPHLFAVGPRPTDDEPSGAPRKQRSPGEWSLEMRRAMFCPVLPGDNTYRVRLFHAVLAGCLPVVALFPGGGWYRPHGPSVEMSMPFAMPGGPERPFVDWRSFAVELPLDPARQSFASWAKRLVPTLLQLGVEEVRARQRRLAGAAALLRWDLHGSRPDAFTALLDDLAWRAAHLWRRPGPSDLECFDPRRRFRTERISVPGREGPPWREETEIFGVVACCPVHGGRSRRARAPGAWATDGLRVRWSDHGEAASGGAESRRLLRRHLKAVFQERRRFDECPVEAEVGP